MKSTYFACYSLLILLLCSSCKKDDEPSDTPTPGQPSDFQIDLGGSVIGFNGDVVVGASVNYRGQSATTDSRGVFHISDVPASEGLNYVEVRHTGHFFGGKNFHVSESGDYSVKIQLMPRVLAGSLQAAAGGSVSTDDGMGLSLPANAIAGGYQGEVKIYAQYIDPTATASGLQMPGLDGINSSGDQGILRSFGMGHFELEDASGNELELADGVVATLTMPVPDDLVSEASSSIPLWYFDQEDGIWREEGSAILQGNTYVGDVSHFSLWNCDDWGCSVWYQISIKCGGVPYTNLPVIVRIESGAFEITGSGVTNSEGIVQTTLPCNSGINIYAVPSGGDEEFLIGSITVASSGEEVLTETLEGLCGPHASVQGQVVDGQGDPVTNGYMFLQFDEFYTEPVFFDESGNFLTSFFSFDPNVLATEAQIIAWNLDNFTTAQGPAVPFNEQLNVLTEPIVIGGAPVSFEGRIYVGSTDPFLFFCLDASDGSVIWMHDLGNLDNKVSPLLQNGLMLVYTLSSEYHCINAVDGSSIWSEFIVDSNSPFGEGGNFFTSSESGRIRSNSMLDAALNWQYQSNSTSLTSAPTVVGDVLYTGLGNNPTGLVALDKDSGDLLWQFDTPAIVKHSPCAADGKVFFGGIDQNFYAIDAITGDEIWQTSLGTGSSLSGNPTAGNGIVYIQTSTQLKALNMNNGNVIWDRIISSGNNGTDPYLDGNRLYVSGLTFPLTCFNAQTGEEIWEAPNSSKYFIVVDNLLIMQRGPAPRTLVALNALTGELLWTSEAEENFDHPMVVVDDNGTAHYVTESGMRQ